MGEVLLIVPIAPDANGEGRAKRAHQWVRRLNRNAHVHVLVVRNDSSNSMCVSRARDDAEETCSVSTLCLASRRWMRGLKTLASTWFGRPSHWPRCNADVREKLTDWRASIGVAKFDRIVCFRLYLSEVAFFLAELEQKRHGGAPVVELDLDDLEVETNEEIARLAGKSRHIIPALLHASSARAFERIEATYLPRFGRVSLCCMQDQALMEQKFPGLRTEVFPNRIFAPGLSNAPLRDANEVTARRILFVGTLCYFPNIQAVLWFATEVLPLLLSREPRWTFAVVGFAAADKLRIRLGKIEGVEFVGQVSSVEQCYSHSEITVAPLRAGGGTKIKVIEALAYGSPLVATAEAARGLGIVDGIHYLLADTAEEFANACMRLVEDPDLAVTLGKAGRRLVEAQYLYGTTSPLEHSTEPLGDYGV